MIFPNVRMITHIKVLDGVVPEKSKSEYGYL